VSRPLQVVKSGEQGGVGPRQKGTRVENSLAVARGVSTAQNIRRTMRIGLCLEKIHKPVTSRVLSGGVDVAFVSLSESDRPVNEAFQAPTRW
jgi:hypothetical protein